MSKEISVDHTNICIEDTTEQRKGKGGGTLNVTTFFYSSKDKKGNG
jgi:hypothetical protein